MIRESRVDEAKTLNPGLLRHQITWQRKVLGDPNTFGEPTYLWTDLVSVKAQVKDISGTEMTAAGQRWAEAKYEIIQHYVPGLKTGDRGLWRVDGEIRYLDITDIGDAAGTGRVLTIAAKEWVDDQSVG